MIFDFLVAFIDALATALTLAIFVRVITSWIPNARLPFRLGEFVWNVSEPLLSPIRRALPLAGGLDLSPLVALLAIQVGERILLLLVGNAR
ncbi:MAG TPA: YggT family protein [Candidatus Limnocylindria bacterium]|nr:YggT family protein [Candidatus Limnocylindria bacterium]